MCGILSAKSSDLQKWLLDLCYILIISSMSVNC